MMSEQMVSSAEVGARVAWRLFKISAPTLIIVLGVYSCTVMLAAGKTARDCLKVSTGDVEAIITHEDHHGLVCRMTDGSIVAPYDEKEAA